ncbi:hypothetical protein AN1V17_31440 [Vallitalea sediminicola]
MIKKIVTLGLGVMLSANLMVPTMASETDQVVNSSVEVTQKVEKGNTQYRDKMVKVRFDKEAKPLTKEEHLAKIQEALVQLEQKYEDGNIEEEKYNQIKEKYTKIIEAIENDEMPEIGKGNFFGHGKDLSKEEMLEKLNEQLAELETKLSDGKIEQDEYDKIKEKLTKTIEAVESGEMPEIGKKIFMKPGKALSKEEMLEKLNEQLEGLETKLSDGKIEQDEYEKIKEKITKTIEAVENGEMPEMGKGKGFMKHGEPLSQEEMLEKLNDKLAGLEEKINSDEITEEQYNSAKERIQEIIEKVENGETISKKARKNKVITIDKDVFNNDLSTQEVKSL